MPEKLAYLMLMDRLTQNTEFLYFTSIILTQSHINIAFPCITCFEDTLAAFCSWIFLELC